MPASLLHIQAETTSQLQAAASLSIVCQPDDLGLMVANGPDTFSFLNSQLTNAVIDLDKEEARLGGYCSAKGRLLASLLYWRGMADDEVYLILSRDLQTAMQKRLSMFVLRAKTRLRDATETHCVFGLAGPLAIAAVQDWFDNLPTQAMHKTDGKGLAQQGQLIRLPDAVGQPRYLLIVPVETAPDVAAALSQTLQPVGTTAWNWLEVQSGIPRITQATQELFVPQMVNFEAIGGVNFRKGCYPGQEVVARSQYRGTIKRRAMLAHMPQAQDLQAGSEIFHQTDNSQPAGHIVNASPAPNGGWDALVEVRLEALQAGTLHHGPTGATLQFLPLPYLLPSET